MHNPELDDCQDCERRKEEIRSEIKEFTSIRSDRTLDEYVWGVNRFFHWLCDIHC